MNVERSPWNTMIGSALLSGAVAGLVAYVVLQNPVAAALTFAACLCVSILSVVSVKAQAQRAEARLRLAESHSGQLSDCGIYADIVGSAHHLIGELQEKVDDAIRARAEIEARSHVRRKQSQLLECAFAGLDQALLITDPHGQLRFHNPPADAVLRQANEANDGTAPKTKTGDDRLRSIPELVLLLEDARMRSAATDRRTAEFEIPHGDATKSFRATATNLNSDNGTLLGTVTVFSEITEERREKSRHAEFISAVSHEFKTPMASIKAFTELLVDGDVADEDERQEVYGFIESQIDRLTRMVDNMLNLTRVESGVIQVHREDCELNDVLNKSLSVIKPTAEDKQIRVCSELSDLYLAAYVDRDLLGQAVINLLANAVKYTPNGGEIRLKSRMNDSEAVIEVSDNGMGIPEASLPHIFDRFYRVPENNKAAAGTGLGLALVHYIVTELHNGSIAVQSKVDEGTTIRITLPLGHRRQSRNEAEHSLARR